MKQFNFAMAACGGNGVGEVAGGSARNSVKIEFFCFAQGDCDDPIFEGKGRMADGVVFDIEFLDPEGVSEIFRSDEGCKPGVVHHPLVHHLSAADLHTATCFQDRFLLKCLEIDFCISL